MSWIILAKTGWNNHITSMSKFIYPLQINIVTTHDKGACYSMLLVLQEQTDNWGLTYTCISHIWYNQAITGPHRPSTNCHT